MGNELMPQKSIELNINIPTKYEIVGNVTIYNLQLDISCGQTMFNKFINVKAYGDQEDELYDFEKIQLIEKHRLPIDTDFKNKSSNSNWLVKYLLIEPLQDNSFPVFIGINSLGL